MWDVYEVSDFSKMFMNCPIMELFDTQATPVYTFFTLDIDDTNIHDCVQLWIHNKEEAMKKYGHISSWDTSNVTNMCGLFKNCATFNEDISSWDVSNVENMSEMFYGANDFSMSIDSWNMNKVKNRKNMMNPKPKVDVQNSNHLSNNGILVFTNKNHVKLDHISHKQRKVSRNMINA